MLDPVPMNSCMISSKNSGSPCPSRRRLKLWFVWTAVASESVSEIHSARSAGFGGRTEGSLASSRFTPASKRNEARARSCERVSTPADARSPNSASA